MCPRPQEEDPGDDPGALFRAEVIDAIPLTHDRVDLSPPPPPAIPRQRDRDERAALDELLNGPVLVDMFLEGGDEAAWTRQGVAPSVLRDLRRGRWALQANLDLHGHTRDEARSALNRFIADCGRRDQRCVRIVHGKGLGSPGREPILKRLVQGWLAQKKEVLAFCQARPSDGGAGAMLVLLRSPK